MGKIGNPFKYYADKIKQNKIKTWNGFIVVLVFQTILTLFSGWLFYAYPETLYQILPGFLFLSLILAFFYGFVFYYWNTLSGKIVLAILIFYTLVRGFANDESVITLFWVFSLAIGYWYAKSKFPNIEK